MLEDDFSDVLRKALAGHGLDPAVAARRAGIGIEEIESLLAGRFSAEPARKLAPVLEMSADACANHAGYEPKPLKHPFIRRLDLPFGHGQVNAWWIESGNQRLLFDAGWQIRDLEAQLAGLHPGHAFITHTHRDHVGGLEWLLETGVPVHAAGIPGTAGMGPGDSVACGPLVVTACDLSGHATPALGYRIEGLPLPVLVTGDALFAGSIGGCATPGLYHLALRHLKTVLAPLPDATVLLPGHGPASTLGEERCGNPFLR
jgi:glyoxylase-like metal-dependent hydrolase (beta-lactamase superfamily II)